MTTATSLKIRQIGRVKMAIKKKYKNNVRRKISHSINSRMFLSQCACACVSALSVKKLASQTHTAAQSICTHQYCDGISFK